MARVAPKQQIVIQRMKQKWRDEGQTEFGPADFNDLVHNGEFGTSSNLSATIIAMKRKGILVEVGTTRGKNNARVKSFTLAEILEAATTPAAQFSHAEHHRTGKDTSSRIPTAKQIPVQSDDPGDAALNEMIVHIKDTEGNSMATGAPRQGTVEYDFAQLDKRIGVLESRLEKAVDALAKAAQESQRINTVGSELEEILDEIRAAAGKADSSNSAPSGDIEHIRAALEKMVESDGKLHGTFMKLIRVSEQEKFHFNAGYTKGFVDGAKSVKDLEKKDEEIILEGKEAMEFLAKITQR